MSNSDKKLKIGLVLDASLDNTDGVQQYIIDIGEWLSQQNYDVHYLVGQTKRRDLKNIHSLSRNVSVKFNGNHTTMPLPTSRHKLRSFLDSQQFDILHVQVPYSPFMAHRLILSAGSKTAIIGTFHVVAYSRVVSFGARILGYWLRSSLKRFSQIVSTSSASADFAKKEFGIDSAVLPCVIDYNRFHNAVRLKQYDDDVVTILFLGRLVPRKGCQQLIEAIILLKQNKDLPKFRVIICGKGPLESKIRHLIKNNQLEDIVSMIGFVKESVKPSYYASADISVFPSTGGESFGIVLLEAMASGRSVVLAGANSGYKTVMSPRPNLLFDPNDVALLAEKLQHFLVNNDQRKTTQAWGAEYAKSFDVNNVGLWLVEIYRQALKKRIIQ